MPSNRPRPGLRYAMRSGTTVERPVGVIPNVRLNTATAIKDYLEANFQPECIRPGESLEVANRRAGEVELAQRLIATIQFAQDQPDPEHLED